MNLQKLYEIAKFTIFRAFTQFDKIRDTQFDKNKD